MVWRLLLIFLYLLSSCSGIDKRSMLVEPVALEPGDRVEIELLRGDRVEGEFESFERDTLAIATASGLEMVAVQSIAEISRVRRVPGVKAAIYVLTTVLVLGILAGYSLVVTGSGT